MFSVAQGPDVWKIENVAFASRKITLPAVKKEAKNSHDAVRNTCAGQHWEITRQGSDRWGGGILTECFRNTDLPWKSNLLSKFSALMWFCKEDRSAFQDGSVMHTPTCTPTLTHSGKSHKSYHKILILFVQIHIMFYETLRLLRLTLLSSTGDEMINLIIWNHINQETCPSV